MRCRVGRKPTWRSIDLTSCHGQPVRSVGDAPACREGFRFRSGFIGYAQKPARTKAGDNRFKCNIYTRNGQMQLLRNWAEMAVLPHFPAGNTGPPTGFVSLPALAGVLRVPRRGL